MMMVMPMMRNRVQVDLLQAPSVELWPDHYQLWEEQLRE